MLYLAELLVVAMQSRDEDRKARRIKDDVVPYAHLLDYADVEAEPAEKVAA